MILKAVLSTFLTLRRGGSRAVATSKMERFVIIVNYYHKALHLGCCSSPRSTSVETIVLSDDFEIVQFSVVDCDSLRWFDQYDYPNGSISFGATKVTGITKSSRKLFCHGKLVDIVKVNVSLNRFRL